MGRIPIVMIIFKNISKLKSRLGLEKRNGKSIGFVPTMGALHEGHLSLIKAALDNNDVTVCSVFVNPAQFNDPRDFEKYPVTLERDVDMLEETGNDILFIPSVDEMYPGDDLESGNHYELGDLEKILEGKYRPGHFQGVCKIVHRLLDIVKPSRIYLGQKDYQQCLVINRLVHNLGLEKELEVLISPTLREPGGLAMSSRNMRLSEAEKEKARNIYRVLQFMKSELSPGNLDHIKEQARIELEKSGFKVDYAEIAAANDLQIIDQWDGREKLVALVAACLGEVRLIDNLLLNPGP